MIRTKIRYSVLLLTSLLAMHSHAQRLWSLDECLDYALEHNLSLKQQGLVVKQNEVGLTESKMRRLPSLNAGATNSFNFGRSIDPFTNTYIQQTSANVRFSLSTGVTLFNGFQIHNSIQQSRQQYFASEFDLKVAQNNVGMSIANAFLQVLFAKELVQVNTEQVKATEVQLDRAQKFYEAGRVAESNVLEMKAQLANDNLSLVNARNQEKLARVTLFQLLMLSPDSNDVKVPLIDTVPDAGVYSPGHLYAMYQEHSSELRAAEHNLEASNYAWKVAQGAYYPRLSIGADLGTVFSNQAKTPIYGEPLFYQSLYDENGSLLGYYPVSNVTGRELTPFGEQLNNNLGQTVGLSLNIPIFNNYSTKANVQRAEINYQSALLNKQITQNNLLRDITQAYTEYEAARARYEASKASYEAQSASFEYAKKRFAENLISPVEFRIFQNNLQSARSNMLQAQYELLFRFKIIDFYKNGTVYPQDN